MTEPATEEKLPHRLPNSSPNAADEALAQADEYESLFGNVDLELEGGGTISVPPHPDYGLMDDDRVAAYEELLFEVDTEYEREQDIIVPEQRLRDEKTGLETGVVVPSTTIQGSIKQPYRKLVGGKSELVKPPHAVRIVQIALGEIEYKRLTEGGRSSKDVWKIWGRQSLKIQERKKRDDKSAAGVVDLAAVPKTDSK